MAKERTVFSTKNNRTSTCKKERTQTQTALHPSPKTLTQNSLIDLNVKHTTKELVEESQQSLAEQQSLDNICGSERPEFPSPDLRSDIFEEGNTTWSIFYNQAGYPILNYRYPYYLLCWHFASSSPPTGQQGQKTATESPGLMVKPRSFQNLWESSHPGTHIVNEKLVAVPSRQLNF